MNSIESSKLTLPEIVAVTGREACGKDLYAEHLVTEYGYLHISAGDVLRAVARNQGFSDPIPREILSKVGDEMKEQYGQFPITASSIDRYNLLKSDGLAEGLVISGLRRVGEINYLKNRDGVVLWIDSDIATRYERQSSRARGGQKDYDDFVKASEKEYDGGTSQGVNTVNLRAIEAEADLRVTNNSDDIEIFFHQADEALCDK